MKRLLSPLLCLSTLSLCMADPVGEDEPAVTEAQANTASLIVDIVAKSHYDALELDDRMSERILASYLANLDPYKDVFLQADIEAFSEFAHALDDGLADGDIAPAFRIFAVFVDRIKERTDFTARFLESDPEFGIENGPEDYSDWAATQKELDARWRARLAREAVRLSHRGSSDVVRALGVRYQQLRRRYQALTSDEVFRHFVDAYLDTLDPHTGYFLPRRRAARGSSGDLQGIGIQLRSRREHVVIKRIFEGGPADRSRQLHVGDRILGVAQGDGEFTDVVAWPLNDVVDLIRGPAGSEVRLQVLPMGSSARDRPGDLSLRRGHIELKEVKVAGAVEEREGHDEVLRIAVIDIPSFYIDYAAYGRGAARYTSTTQDLERFLRASQQAELDGLLIDLRGNRGGALIEAVRLAGLFISDGPIVQVRDNAGAVTIHRDTDPRIVYAGPLAVLIDRYSASASEIFAGAIQDYGRGIVLGERSYGKGTVQQTFDLNSAPGSSHETMGQLVLTIAKYFRVTGESTQLRGVAPDIPLAAVYAASEYGESVEENSLKWERVRAVKYRKAHGAGSTNVSPYEDPRFAGSTDGVDAFESHEHKSAAVLAQAVDALVEMVDAGRQETVSRQ